MPGLRNLWVEPPGFAERAAARFATLAAIPADRVVLFTHAARADKPDSRTALTLRMLEPFGIVDFPLWDSADVEHSSRGHPVVIHNRSERDCMIAQLSPYLPALCKIVGEGRAICCGYVAIKFFSTMPEFKTSLEAGEITAIRYPCDWSRWPEGVHQALRQALLNARRDVARFDEETFLARVKSIAHDVQSAAMEAICLAVSPEEKVKRSQRKRAAWSLRTPEQKAAAREKYKATITKRTFQEKKVIANKRISRAAARIAAMTQEERAARRADISAKSAATLAALPPEEKAARKMRQYAATFNEEVQRRRTLHLAESRAKRTPEQRAATSAKMRSTRSSETPEKRAARSAKMVASRKRNPNFARSIVAMHAKKTPEQREAENSKHRATCAAWTPEQRAKRVANIKAGISARTAERRLAAVEKFKKTQASKTEEQKEERAMKYLETMSQRSPEEVQSRKEKISAGHLNRSEEDKVATAALLSQQATQQHAGKAAANLQRFLGGTMDACEEEKIYKSGMKRRWAHKKNPPPSVCQELEDLFDAIVKKRKGTASSSSTA